MTATRRDEAGVVRRDEHLLARQGEVLRACHVHTYGAPLADGVLSGERIVCPWHHACFNVLTGNREEPPAIDSLPRYDVRAEDGRVWVRVPDEAQDRRTPTMASPDNVDKRVFVILGGGASGYSAAQTLREDGFEGRILIITRENRLPYDRPNLSKDYLQGHAEPEWMPLRPQEFFDEHGIEVMFGREVTRVDATSKTITFSDGVEQRYDALLVATGGVPRSLPLRAPTRKSSRPSIQMRTRIEAATHASRAVVIGGSFIGMEVASSLIERGCSVTVVAPGSVPFQKVLGAEIGGMFQRLHESHGVDFRLGLGTTRFEGEGKVAAVILIRRGLDADLVVVGIGVAPATGRYRTEYVHTDGGVVVDKHLRAADCMYAAGDIAWFPAPLTGERQRIEHWRTALQQGKAAANNMAGKGVAYTGVPFFWTQQFDVRLSYVGHAERWDDIIVDGDVASRDFLAFFVKGNRAIAVAGMNRDREMAAIEELMRQDRLPTPDQLRSGHVKVVELLHTQS